MPRCLYNSNCPNQATQIIHAKTGEIPTCTTHAKIAKFSLDLGIKSIEPIKKAKKASRG
ncbi:MAG: hypothetical protein ACXABY_03560 [Candidatus Thorarchaeota archaeon]|jgi:hypothetical protein